MKLTKSSLGRKEFHLTAHRSQVITGGSQGGNLRQEPKQKLRRNIAYWLSFHVWFSLLSQDPCPEVVLSCRRYHIKKMLHRHANSPVWWRALLNWGPSPKWLEFVLRWQKPTSSLSEVIQAYIQYMGGKIRRMTAPYSWLCTARSRPVRVRSETIWDEKAGTGEMALAAKNKHCCWGSKFSFQHPHWVVHNYL